jgi:hypothetical protein
MRTTRVLATLAWLSACGGDAIGPASGGIDGEWGGRSAGLVVEGNAARLELDCGGGSFEALVMEGDRFTALGTLSRGPLPINPPGPARLSGELFALGWMRLSVTLTDEDLVLGPFWLRRGADPVIFYCL